MAEPKARRKQPGDPVEAAPVNLEGVVDQETAKRLRAYGIHAGVARTRSGGWAGGFSIQVPFAPRETREDVEAAMGGVLEALTAALDGARDEHPPVDPVPRGVRASYIAALAAHVPDHPESQGLPAMLTADVIYRCPPGTKFRSHAAIERYVAEFTGSEWWQERYPFLDKVRLLPPSTPQREDRELDDAGWMRWVTKGYRHIGWVMFIDPAWRYELIVLHELAHGLLQASGVAPHGPEFMRMWVDLVEHQLGWAVAEHLTSLIHEAGRQLASDAKAADAVRGTAQMVRIGREPRKRTRRGFSVRDFQALERSWGWQFDLHLRHFARQIGSRSDQAIVSVCRRAGDTEVTMRLLRELLHRYEGTEEPPDDEADRRLARRALVAVGCTEPYLARLGLDPDVCGLSDDDVTWETNTRELMPSAPAPQG